MRISHPADISHQVVLSKPKVSLSCEIKTTLLASSDFHLFKGISCTRTILQRCSCT